MFVLVSCRRHGLLQKDSVLSSEFATVETPEALGIPDATLMALEKSGGIVMFDKMWIFETNFSCFPFFRKSSCNMRVRNRMIVCFTLLFSNPKCFLVWILAVVSQIFYVNFAVHLFFKTMAIAISILCAVCFAATCCVWFFSVLTPTTWETTLSILWCAALQSITTCDFQQCAV